MTSKTEKKPKPLKIWNGRGHRRFDRGTIYVAAYSMKQAAELVGRACETYISANEIKVYYSPCWGNAMNGIIPTEPCVYATKIFGDEKPLRII